MSNTFGRRPDDRTTIILHITGVELVVLTVCIASIQHVIDAVLSEDMVELSVVSYKM